MNKKLLFAAMSLAAFTACTDNNFESQKVAEETSPVEFEIINTNDAFTRASMGGTDNNTISWSAKDGDLFTLYYGAPVASVTNYDNATFKATVVSDKPAALTTPTMIKAGEAIMVWPVDTTFRINPADNLTLTIPAEQKNTADEIPYVSDRIKIATYKKWDESTDAKKIETTYNVAGMNRKYPVYMRPMASQLNLKADYAGTDAKIAELYTGDDHIEKIQVTSIDLLTQASSATEFTTEIPVTFNETANAGWAEVDYNAWSAQTGVNRVGAVQKTDKLTAKDKCLLPDNVGCKILLLPQPEITGSGVVNGAVVVNTIYGKVYVAGNGVGDSKYTVKEAEDAWTRYIKETTTAETYEKKGAKITSGEFKDKCKTTTTIAEGMMQTINAFGNYTAPASLKVIAGEQMGTAATRYVKVLLTHLDMSDLHIKTDKQLRDAARVWDKLGLDDVTVLLDGDANNEFAISQKTIETINTINAAATNKFKVKPCQEAEHKLCKTIVVTGGGDVPNLTFIAKNGSKKADVAFNAGENWKWKGDVKVTALQINSFINRGTMQNAEGATLRVMSSNGTYQQFDVPFVNDGTWNITAGTLRVQFNVTNNGQVNISKGAQYRQDGQDVAARKTTFTNEATDKPSRFGGNDSKIGKVENKGVFATIGGADINNYGLIEHADKDAKTYITTNQQGGAFGTVFGATNKMGRINLPYSNKDEDNISISAAASEGFVSVTVSTGNGAPASKALNEDVVGTFVNYLIVNGGIETINKLPTQVKYVEIADANGAEIVWDITEETTPAKTAQYEGLMILSPVNIKLGTTVTATVTYLDADMYVGGIFNKSDITTPVTKAATNWAGYYGDTSGKVATKYITF